MYQDVKALHHVALALKDNTSKYYVPWDKIVTEILMPIIPAQKNKHHQSHATGHAAHHR